MKFEIQHTPGAKTLTIEGLEQPYYCFCIDSLNLHSNTNVDQLAELVYKAAGTTSLIEGGLDGRRELAIVDLSNEQIQNLKSLCKEAQKKSPDLHLLIRNIENGRWKRSGDEVLRAFLRVPQEDFDRIQTDLQTIELTDAHLAALKNGYFEDLAETGNELADVAMKAFLDRKINRNVLARALAYVAYLQFEDNDEYSHFLQRDGTVNQEKTENYISNFGNGQRAKTKSLIYSMEPEMDGAFNYTKLPAFVELDSAINIDDGFSVEANGVLHYSSAEDFGGPRRDVFLPYHRLPAPERIHGTLVQHYEVHAHDLRHQQYDSDVGKRGFWTTVGFRCLREKLKVEGDFCLDRAYKYDKSSTIKQVLLNVKYAKNQKEFYFNNEQINSLEKIVKDVLKTYSQDLEFDTKD